MIARSGCHRNAGPGRTMPIRHIGARARRDRAWGAAVGAFGGGHSLEFRMTSDVHSETSKTPALAAMYAGYAVGAVGIGLGFSKSSAVGALKPVMLLTVGVLGLVSFVRHVVFHRSDAARMGWDRGAPNNFQIEVGLANLAWGLLAFATVGWHWGVSAEASVALIFALYLLGAFVLHVSAIYGGSEQRSGAAAWGPALATVVLAGIVGWFALAALAASHFKPFG